MKDSNKDKTSELWEVFAEVDEDKKKLVAPLIEEVETLIEQINEIKKYDFFRPVGDKGRVKVNESFKVYKDLLAQLNITIKNLSTFLKREEGEELSPLEKYIENLK